MTSVTSTRARDHAEACCSPVVEQRRFLVTPATAGDHPAIHSFLRSVYQQPSTEEFQAQLDEPSYEPVDRLLVKSQDQIVAHLRVVRREIRWGAQVLPVPWLADLATLPEYRGQGCASELLQAAERQLQQAGTLVALTQVTSPAFYRRHGWVACGRQSYSLAGAREILANLQTHASAGQEPLSPRLPKLHLRYWRYVEQAALMRLYDECMRTLSGPGLRRGSYWRWLIGRHACNRVYVAIEGSPKLELDDTLARVVGYAFVKGARVVELASAQRRPDADAALLARVCSEAIECDLDEIRFDAPPQHPLHAVLIAAGGVHNHREVERGAVFMAKVFDVGELLQTLEPELLARVRKGALPWTEELGLDLDGEKYLLHFSKHRLGFHSGKLGRSYLRCGAAEFTQLVLGDLDLEQAVRAGRLETSSRRAFLTASTLFPPQSIWYPPLDDLSA
ncbi:MAG: GNAT family N-acetyltransferase [Planctomycetota bacterium]|nr:GNAT family N-acetyltransferase [Planctomycetota bacterium]